MTEFCTQWVYKRDYGILNVSIVSLVGLKPGIFHCQGLSCLLGYQFLLAC